MPHSIRLVLVTHGPLAESLILVSQSMVSSFEDVFSICLGPDRSLQSLTDRVIEVSGSGNVLLMTDLPAGSSTSAAGKMIKSNSVEVVTGVNLSMLLSALANRDRLDLRTLVQKVVGDGRKSILNLREELAHRPIQNR